MLSNEKSSTNMAAHKIIGWVGWVAIVGAVLTYGVVAVHAYVGHWENKQALNITKKVPVPIGLVAGQPLWYSDYVNHVLALSTYNDYLVRTKVEGFKAQSVQATRELAIAKIVRDQGTIAALHQFRIGILQADVDQAYTAQLSQNGNSAQIATTIKTYYGWTPEEFKHGVIRPVVAREKLREKLSFDDQLNALPRKQAENVLALVKKGDQAFEDLAKTYSEDSYALQGGDLGFFPAGQQLKEIDDLAFSLQPGQTSNLIHTKFGWHILQVLEQKEVAGQAQVHAREIFIASPDVDQYLTRWLSGRVLLFQSGWRWDNTKGEVTAR